MNQQLTCALQSMTEWLSHPDELGKKPASIEPAGEFDLYDLHYYIFKYKKSLLGKWLLGVCGGYEENELEHCGHVFSNMAPYNPATATEDAIALVEMIRQYWMNRAKEAEDNTADPSLDSRGFVGFVLLSSPKWNPEKFKTDLLTDWGIECLEDAADPSDDPDDFPPLVFSIGDALAAVSLMPGPVPDDEAVTNASSNYMWPEAVEITKKHQAHLIVAIMGSNVPVLEAGKLFVKLTAACCKQDNVLGINTSGTVFEPSYYLNAAMVMKEGEIPVLNWIYFGLYQSEDGLNAYTFGMKALGKDEMEVLHVHDTAGELHSFLFDMVYYVLAEDVVLHDGETIGFSAEQKLAIRRSEGVSLDGITLKIEYPRGQN